MARYPRIVVLTGAGLSAESGVPTFRDAGGIWAKYDFREVATPQGYAKNPLLVHEFYNLRRRDHANCKPNAAHFALARLEREHPDALIVTQNVDALQEAAGATRVIHMHGELLSALCARCGARHAWPGDLAIETVCPACHRDGGMRPDVVWFGEMPYRMEEIGHAIAACDLFISIGTSGHVYPASGFVAQARAHGAHTVELNLEPSEGAKQFHEHFHGKATQVVPTYIDRLLSNI